MYVCTGVSEMERERERDGEAETKRNFQRTADCSIVSGITLIVGYQITGPPQGGLAVRASLARSCFVVQSVVVAQLLSKDEDDGKETKKRPRMTATTAPIAKATEQEPEDWKNG